MTMTDTGSPTSTVEMDEDTTHASSPVRADPDPHPRQDSRSSLQHVLGSVDVSMRGTPPASMKHEMTEDEDMTPGLASIAPEPRTRKKKDKDSLGDDNAQSYYSGNKIRHLKKDDGEPLWRRDIQYDFLKLVFENDQRVFTNSYEPNTEKQTFAELYIDAMARSSKTSKILREKLLTEHDPAKNMAMVCLLVNLGRMNTTLNFFPEMRAQLRTYHAIPSLQAHQDPNSYKQLQDAPRLKSILKGASEDRTEPNTVERIKEAPVPRTNPVNLIFVLSQFAPKVTDLHFPASRDFYDLIMRTSLSSSSRATAFLWLMWFYLESDFTEEGAEENPFGRGVMYQEALRNQGVPDLEPMTQLEENLENVDTPEEKEYGIAKMRERKRIIEADQAAFQAEHGPPKRGPKPKLHLPPDDGGPAMMSRIRSSEGGASPAVMLNRIRQYESDLDSTRSTPPPKNFGVGGMRIQSVLNKGKTPLRTPMVEGSSPVAYPSESVSQMRRPRPLTAHQLAVEQYRNDRVDLILTRGIHKQHDVARKRRKQNGAFFRAMSRAKLARDPLENSEGEEALLRDPAPFRERGFVGLVQLETEEDDFGEEVSAYAAALRRSSRRLDRWEGQKGLKGVMGTNRVPQFLNDRFRNENDETEDEQPRTKRLRRSRSRSINEEDLDNLEREILGMESGEDDDPDLDDVDKELLGLGGNDETEDDDMDVD